jgi:hypothetical protein
MTVMKIFLRTKTIVAAALAIGLAGAGAAFAAGRLHGSKAAPAVSGSSPVSAAGPGASAGGFFGFGHRAFGPMHAGRGGDLATAASYLGLDEGALRTQLQGGKTLAQIADATPGKSAKGLIDALVAHEKNEIEQAVTAGRLSRDQANRIEQNLADRVTALVNGTFPRGWPGPGFDRGHGPGDDLAAAASYLGLDEASVRAQLEAGKTLAQIADATPGKSAKGLVDALVAHEKAEIEQAVTAGRLGRDQADRIEQNLADRVTALVNGEHPQRPDHGWGSVQGHDRQASPI